MALTPEEFESLRVYQSKVDLLFLEVQKLRGLMNLVIEHSDPNGALNEGATMQRVAEEYLPIYASYKAEVLAAYNNLP